MGNHGGQSPASSIGREALLIVQLNELDRYDLSPDDQLGVATLLKAELPDRVPNLPAYDSTSEISSYLLNSLNGQSPSPDLMIAQ